MGLLDLWKWNKEAGEDLASTVFGRVETKKEISTETANLLVNAPQLTRTLTYQPSTSANYLYAPTYQIESPYATIESKKEASSQSTPSVSVVPTSTITPTSSQTTEQGQSSFNMDSMSLILIALLGVGAVYFLSKGKKK